MPPGSACHDRQRGIVELRRVVAHLVGGREERHDVDAHGGEQGDRRRLPAPGQGKAGRYEIKPDGEAERDDRDAARSDQRRQHEKRDDNEREAHGQNDQHRPTEKSLPRLGWVKLGVIKLPRLGWVKVGVIKLPSAHGASSHVRLSANAKGPRAVPECAAVDNSDAQQPRYHAKPSPMFVVN